jgi:hypothetical protein
LRKPVSRLIIEALRGQTDWVGSGFVLRSVEQEVGVSASTSSNVYGMLRHLSRERNDSPLQRKRNDRGDYVYKIKDGFNLEKYLEAHIRLKRNPPPMPAVAQKSPAGPVNDISREVIKTLVRLGSIYPDDKWTDSATLLRVGEFRDAPASVLGEMRKLTLDGGPIERRPSKHITLGEGGAYVYRVGEGTNIKPFLDHIPRDDGKKIDLEVTASVSKQKFDVPAFLKPAEPRDATSEVAAVLGVKTVTVVEKVDVPKKEEVVQKRFEVVSDIKNESAESKVREIQKAHYCDLVDLAENSSDDKMRDTARCIRLCDELLDLLRSKEGHD